MEKDNLFMSAEDIARVTGMSEQYAYKLIKQLNSELEAKAISQFVEELVSSILKNVFME